MYSCGALIVTSPVDYTFPGVGLLLYTAVLGQARKLSWYWSSSNYGPLGSLRAGFLFGAVSKDSVTSVEVKIELSCDLCALVLSSLGRELGVFVGFRPRCNRIKPTSRKFIDVVSVFEIHNRCAPASLILQRASFPRGQWVKLGIGDRLLRDWNYKLRFAVSVSSS